LETKVKEINDTTLIAQFVSSLFSQLPVSLIHQGVQIPIKVLDSTKSGIVIPSTGISDKSRILTFTNSGNLYNFYFKVSEQSTAELEYLIPEKMLIFPSVSRRVERKTLSSEEQDQIFISSIILTNEILNRIGFDEKWKDIIGNFISVLKSIFSSVSFISVFESNPRVKLAKLLSKPFRSVEVSHFSMKAIFSERKDLESFLKPEEWEKIESGEVLFPVLYRNKIFLGVLSIQVESELTQDQYNLTVQTLQSLQKALHTREEVYYYRGKILIEDISKQGMGFLLPKRENLQPISPSSKILLEIKFIKGLTAFLEATVRNIRPEDMLNFRVGCEFINVSAEEKIFLENFLPSEKK